MISFFPSRVVAVQILGFGIHWYGILYLVGFLIGWFLLPRIQKYRDLELSSDEWSSILSAAVLGVILGGRLGFVLFYDPQYYLAHPAEIFAVWNGGMSSHGGFIGVTIALWIALRKKSWQERLRIADLAVVPIAIGLSLGRIGNFINQELYGTVTTLPWGIMIPGVEGLRHPTQIYEMLTDLFTALLCFLSLKRSNWKPGQTLSLFLILYCIFRFLIEFLRVQDYPLTQIGAITLTRGQLLTIPVFLIGVALYWFVSRKKNR